MIARGFRPVAWVAAIGAAALSCYMLSLQVASERSELASLERRIVSTRQDIRQLQTELGTRGRLQQLEAWNADVLALSAPIAGQFLDSGVSLARFDTRQPSIEERAAEVRLASAEVPAPSSQPANPIAVPPRQATLAVHQASAPSLEPARPLVRRASLAMAEAPTVPTPRRAATRERARPLLDEGTLTALRRESRAEGRGGTAD